MDILRITHIDFVLTFECNSLQRIWEKGCQRLGAHHLTSTYTWSDDCNVERTDEYERKTAAITQVANNHLSLLHDVESANGEERIRK